MTPFEKVKKNLLAIEAEIAKFEPQNPEEYQQYQLSLKYYRDIKNVTDTAKEEGRMEEKESLIRAGLKEGLSISLLSKITGISQEDIEKN